MNEYQEQERMQQEDEARFEPVDARRWLGIAVLVLLVATGVAFGYGYHQHSLVQQLNTQVSASNTQMSTLQSQVSALTAKLNSLSAAQTAPAAEAPVPGSPSADNVTVAAAEIPETPAAAPTPAAPPAAKATHKHPAAKKHPQVDTKYAKLQAQLDEQAKQLKETQDVVEKDRADLEGNLSSTRDELNGSIAKTHEELVVLEKRGERSYFEFDLSKSKQFQRIGPITLSLRKADTKHKSFDLAMIVDDNELNKKKVNLYEPIWIHTENESQPTQIVVNRIDKDAVHGYVSAAKYKPSELTTAGGAAVTPVSSKAPGAGSANPTDQQQPQSRPPEQ